MENNDNKIKKNEQKKVMSRRSFFRRAAGMVLPAIALARNAAITHFMRN